MSHSIELVVTMFVAYSFCNRKLSNIANRVIKIAKPFFGLTILLTKFSILYHENNI